MKEKPHQHFDTGVRSCELNLTVPKLNNWNRDWNG